MCWLACVAARCAATVDLPSEGDALVIETEDPIELATTLRVIRERPQLAAEIRRQGRATARAYSWDRVITQLLLRIELAAAQQGVQLRGSRP